MKINWSVFFKLITLSIILILGTMAFVYKYSAINYCQALCNATMGTDNIQSDGINCNCYTGYHPNITALIHNKTIYISENIT